MSPALLRHTQALADPCDPWLLLEGPAPRAAWADQQICFVAGGHARHQTVSGPARFSALEGSLGGSLGAIEDLSPAPPTTAPIWLCGGSFQSTTPASATWEGWPAAELWAPNWLCWRGPGDDGEQRTYLIAQRWWDGQPRTRAAAEQALSAQLDTLHRALRQAPAAHTPPQILPSWPQPTDAAQRSWCQRVSAATEQMRAAQDPVRQEPAQPLQKVVLAHAQHIPAPTGQQLDPFATARELLRQQPRCTVFLLQRTSESGQRSTFVGASPEELLSLRGRRLSTVALAGTRRRAQSREEDTALGSQLQGSTKDQIEHRLVIDAIKAALLPLSIQLQIAAHPEIMELADLQHLRSPISAVLRADVSAIALLDRLHPTPAVGGLPRAEALAWLAQHEPLDRGWYAAPVGWIGQDAATFVVAIRSAMLHDTQAWAYAGCGLVAASDPMSEWHESQHKLAPIRRALCIQPEPAPIPRASHAPEQRDPRGIRS